MRKGDSDAESKRRLVERARRGGLALMAKYGKAHFARIGALGGRPTWRQALTKARRLESR